MAERDWSWVMDCFRVHSQDAGQPACYLRHGQGCLLLSLLMDGAGGEDLGQKGLYLSPLADGAISGFITRIMVSESSTWTWACLLKTAYLGLGLHPSNLLRKSQSSHKDTFVCGWLPNYCCYGSTWIENLLFRHLADVTSCSVLRLWLGPSFCSLVQGGQGRPWSFKNWSVWANWVTRRGQVVVASPGVSL